MPKTESSPLTLVQKQAEVTKKLVEKLVKECNKTIKNTKLKDKDVKQKQLFKECFKLKKDATAVHSRVEELTEEDEPKKMKNYNNKRDFEIKRLVNLQNQLSQVMPKLCPEEDEEAFIKELLEAGEISDVPVNDDEDDEVEDETDNAKAETHEEIKDSPKSSEKPEKNNGKKNKKDKDDVEDEIDESTDKKGKDKKDKDKDKLKKKDADKEKKDKNNKEKDKDLDKKNKDKDKKDKDNKDKDNDKKDIKDKKEKDKKEKDKKDTKSIEHLEDKEAVVEVPKEYVEDYEEESEEEEEDDEEDDDIEEDIDGDDEEEDDDDDEEPETRKHLIKTEAVKQMQPKTSPKEVADNLKTIHKDEEEDSEEEETTEDEDDEEETSEIPKEKSVVVSKIVEKNDEDEEEEEEDEEDDEEDEEDEEGEEEDEEEEDDDDDDRTDKKEDDQLEVTQPTTRFIAIDDFDAAEEGDLSVKRDEIIRIIETREDGWWVGENEKGDQGMVPKTYLQMYNPYKNIQQPDEEEEEKVEEGEEGEGEKGEIDGEVQTPGKSRSGKQLWGSLKKTVNETLVSDVLHAMGAGPSGFRLPTLSKYFNESDKFRMKNFLSPKLSSSNLSYRDLFFNPASGEMRAIDVRVERVITISSCQQIPPPGSGIVVQRRYVRICLFDGQNVLSNVHTIRVASEDKTERNWSFSSRISDVMDVQLHNEFFVRTNSTHNNIGVLFELCVSCVKTKTEERGEFSCGWVHLPLTDKTGVPIANKGYDLYVHGGTPYERDIEVDPSVSRRASSNALVSLISGNKQPRLVIKVGLPSKEQKSQLDLLPEVLIGDMCLLPFYTYYRQILADALVIKRLDLDSTEPIHSPFLHLFPQVGDHPDLMNLFRESWISKLKLVKRAERRDIEAMKTIFQEVFMESIYPVISTSNLVPYKTGNTEIEMKRKNAIQKVVQIKHGKKNALAVLLSSDIIFTPFDMSEVTFNAISPYSLSETFVSIPVEAS